MTILFHVSVTRLEHMSFFPPAQRDTPFWGQAWSGVPRGRRLEGLIFRGVVYACKIIGRYQGLFVRQLRPSVFPLLH